MHIYYQAYKMDGPMGLYNKNKWLSHMKIMKIKHNLPQKPSIQQTLSKYRGRLMTQLILETLYLEIETAVDSFLFTTNH